jgi:hypothetical protein
MVPDNFEKAYDKVRWDFLQQSLRMKGFSAKWCGCIQSFVQRGNAGIKVNDQIGAFFQTKKGVWQGDPLSPILFNMGTYQMQTMFWCKPRANLLKKFQKI